jgi:plasmid stabilization system protein ParE
LRLIIRKDAENDIAEAYHWYQGKREGLGNEFIEEISRTIGAVYAEPLRFPRLFRQLRRAKVQRFPYGVFFIKRDDAVVIVAAMHFGRNPWRILMRARSEF